MLLSSACILVTGGSRGIGRAICETAARDGADVAFCYRSNDEAASETVAAIESHGRRALSIKADVGDRQASADMVAQVVEAFGRIDGLVLNAGINRGNLFLRLPHDDWDELVRVNVGSLYNVGKPVYQQMASQRSGPHRRHHVDSGHADGPGWRSLRRHEVGERRFCQRRRARGRTARHPVQRHRRRRRRHRSGGHDSVALRRGLPGVLATRTNRQRKRNRRTGGVAPVEPQQLPDRRDHPAGRRDAGVKREPSRAPRPLIHLRFSRPLGRTAHGDSTNAKYAAAATAHSSGVPPTATAIRPPSLPRSVLSSSVSTTAPPRERTTPFSP